MRHLFAASALTIALLLSACTSAPPASTPVSATGVDEEAQVRAFVEAFGVRLQSVSLFAPDAGQQVELQYAAFASPALLETWKRDPTKAPGRLVSSPWPDHIEITSITREGAGKYVVTGSIIEMSSSEVTGGGTAAQIPVHLVVERGPSGWVITEYTEER